MIIEVLLVGLLPPADPAVGEGERGEVPVEVETGVGLGLCWPAARAELLGTAAAAAYIAPPPGGGTGPGCGLRLLAASHGTTEISISGVSIARVWSLHTLYQVAGLSVK